MRKLGEKTRGLDWWKSFSTPWKNEEEKRSFVALQGAKNLQNLANKIGTKIEYWLKKETSFFVNFWINDLGTASISDATKNTIVY